MVAHGIGEFARYTKFDVGDGSKIRFLHAMWYRDQTLKETFPKLYRIARIKNAFVVDHLELTSGSH